jgi:Na+-transporting methylmalonyl-CoA/oxaloacetate decarboxylase gamma subunit
MSPLVQSLWVTLIGMGLVLVAVSLLWGLMAGLVVLSNRYGKEETPAGEEHGEPEEILPEPVTETSSQKKRAAAAAVAIAMALRKPVSRTAAASQGSGSAWQAVTRASQLNQPTHVTRKTRGSVR